VADGDRAHRLPAGWQVERERRDVLAEQGAGDPRRAEPLDRQRDEQVLHRRAHGHDEHGLLRSRPPLIRIGVRRGSHQARHHDQRRVPQHVPAPDPPADLLRSEPVAAQVSRPRREHRVEQRRARRGRLHDHEPPRLAVVRRGRGQRRGDRAPHGGAGHRLTGKSPDRSAGQRDIGRPEAEHVLLGGPDQLPCPRAVLLGDQVVEPADHGHRDVQ
jgi:hypothetical protein